MPVEGPAEGVRLWVNGSQEATAVDERRRLPEAPGRTPPGLRRAEGDQAEVAVARLLLGQGSPKGKKTGPNLADKAKRGTKRHILTDRKGTYAPFRRDHGCQHPRNEGRIRDSGRRRSEETGSGVLPSSALESFA
jgi:hypothetical protein